MSGENALTEHPEQFRHRSEELIDNPLLQRNDPVIRDVDALRTNLRAALGNVAQPDAVLVFQIAHPIFCIERIHLLIRRINQESWTNEVLMNVMVAQHVANVRYATPGLSKLY